MSKYSNASNHIDKSVIYVFIAVFFVSVSVFAYRYTKFSPCEEVNFNIITKERSVGTLIKFEDLTVQAENWEWNFGDSTITSSLQKPLHVYKKPGEYEVKLMVNNICEHRKTITIRGKEEILDSTKFPVFKVQKSIKVGQKLTLRDETENASTWEWRFGETARVNAITRKASYVYEKPGLKTISLIVNGDLKYITEKTIEVIPLKEVKDNTLDVPEVIIKQAPNIKQAPSIKQAPANNIKQAPDKPKLSPYINEADFSAKLMSVARESKSSKIFSEYFCGDVNKPIIVNGKNTTFLLFCKKISGKRRTKIKKIELYRDKGSNCITNVTIDCKIPGLFND